MSRTTLTLVLALVLPTLACDGKPTRSPEEAHDELGDGQLSGQGPGGVGGLLDGKADPKIVEAEALLAEGKHERGLALIDEAIAAEPNQARFHYVRGNALSYLDRDAEAEAAYRRAIELDPDDALPHAALGNLLAFGAQATPELQRAAIQQFQAALEREPRLAVAHQSLGVVLLELGEYDKAVEALDNADRLAPNVETSYALAEAHGKLGNVEQAITHAKSAVEFAPDASGVDLRLLYARLLMRGDRNDDAAREFERAAALVPDSPPLRLEVARGLLEMGKADAAMVHMQWLLEAAPHEVPVIVNHGRILVAQGQANAAIKRFDDALKIQADSQAAQTYKIEALVAAKRCKDAKKVFDGLARQLGWTKGQPLPRALSKAQAYLDAGKC